MHEFLVDYFGISVNNIFQIHKYLMRKHNKKIIEEKHKIFKKFLLNY